jgi:hypothetical protein
MFEHRAGKIAMRIKQSDACTIFKILAQQIEQQRAFAGAGLADDVEMSVALVRIPLGTPIDPPFVDRLIPHSSPIAPALISIRALNPTEISARFAFGATAPPNLLQATPHAFKSS